MPHHKIYPSSGVRQGCPLCLSIFAMLISPLAQKLTSISEHVQVLLYADDLLIIIVGAPNQAVFVFILARADIKIFYKFSRLRVNCKKSALLSKDARWKRIK